MTTTIGPHGGIIVQLPENEVLHFFWDLNPDQSTANKGYVSNMTKMIWRVTNKGIPFSPKQSQWILSKIRFVLKQNKTLGMSNKNIEGFEIT
jgi:hypothetical protein